MKMSCHNHWKNDKMEVLHKQVSPMHLKYHELTLPNSIQNSGIRFTHDMAMQTTSVSMVLIIIRECSFAAYLTCTNNLVSASLWSHGDKPCMSNVFEQQTYLSDVESKRCQIVCVAIFVRYGNNSFLFSLHRKKRYPIFWEQSSIC